MDPGARWTWPERRQYLTHFREFVKALGGKAFAHQSAYYVEGYGGASLWLPPNVRPNEEAIMALFRRTASPQIQSDLAKYSNRWGVIIPVNRIGIFPSSV
jgi:hypothetical protein